LECSAAAVFEIQNSKHCNLGITKIKNCSKLRWENGKAQLKMEYFVKTEPLDLMDTPQECILCEDGKKYLNVLVQHFQENHKGKQTLK
jgi:hypothetical protein